MKGPGLALAAAALLLLAASCAGNSHPGNSGRSPAASPQGFPLTLQRADGKSLTLQVPPQRIVSLSPGYTEILFAIGAGDQVVGVDTTSDYPPEAGDRTKLDARAPDSKRSL